MTLNCELLSRPHPLKFRETVVGSLAPVPPLLLPAKWRVRSTKGSTSFLIEVMGAWPLSSRDKEFQLGLREPLMRPAWKANDTVQPDTLFPGEELGHLPIL